MLNFGSVVSSYMILEIGVSIIPAMSSEVAGLAFRLEAGLRRKRVGYQR